MRLEKMVFKVFHIIILNSNASCLTFFNSSKSLPGGCLLTWANNLPLLTGLQTGHLYLLS